MTDKVILSNGSALTAKYQSAGEKAIRTAIQALIAADSERGLKTVYIKLDDAAAMKKVKVAAVTDVRSGAQNKKAVDAVYKALAPDYILLLGAVDVIPHQELTNPVFNPRRPDDDDDRVVPSDLPYACEAPYSRAIESFTGATRVVGRLPDLTGGSDPAYLIDVLKTAASAQPRTRTDYEKYLGLSADVWKKSTALSLRAIFGSSADERNCPPGAPPWTPSLLSRLSHFINCHGAPRSPDFFGQKGTRYPVSYSARTLTGKLAEGVVAAMECCYGAELYAPTDAKGQAGIGNTYLANKAYGYLGSTTTAYGPADTNGWADVLCQYFLESILAGASLGRALLEARQKYIQTGPTPLGPVDLKTLGQFVLLGDPSIQPVKAASETKAGPRSKSMALTALQDDRASRIERRKDLMVNGLALARTWPAVRSRHVALRPGAMRKRLGALAKEAGMKEPSMLTFTAPQTRAVTAAQPKALLSKQPDVTAVHVMLERQPPPPENEGIRRTLALVVREAAGQVVSVTRGFAK